MKNIEINPKIIGGIIRMVKLTSETLFSEHLLTEIRDRFAYIDIDPLISEEATVF